MSPIDGDLLLEEIEKFATGYNGHDGFYEARQVRACIKLAPTIDAVSVVRCRDCKRFEPHTEVDTERGGCYPPGKAFSVRTVHENDYCSYGRKMDEEES